MTDQDFQTLEMLLRKFRDNESVDREEWDKRESLRFDVEFECKARGISILPNVADQTVDRSNANGVTQSGPAESVLLGGAAPTCDADGIRHTERAHRPLSPSGDRTATP